MENGAHALYMAFAIFIFILAISLAFTTFSQAREVADLVLYYNDKTNFDEYVESLDNLETGVARHVDINVIVPLIRNYIYRNDGYSIEVHLGSDTYIFDIDELPDNGSKTEHAKNWENNLKEIITKYKNNYNGRQFKEFFSEVIWSGGLTQLGNGETFEKVNTITKVKIIYELIY